LQRLPGRVRPSLPTARPEGRLKQKAVHRKEWNSGRAVQTVGRGQGCTDRGMGQGCTNRGTAAGLYKPWDGGRAVQTVGRRQGCTNRGMGQGCTNRGTAAGLYRPWDGGRAVQIVEQRPPTVCCNAVLVLEQLNRVHTQHVSCIHAPLPESV